MYLICDSGYLCWPQSICPYSSTTAASAEGYFSSNLERVRKDVECTFGIMKKRWKILNNGLMYRDIKVCEKIVVTCSCLHNMLVDNMDIKHLDTRVGRGAPLGKDGIYLDGHTLRPPNVDKSDLYLAKDQLLDMWLNTLSSPVYPIPIMAYNVMMEFPREHACKSTDYY
jgi:hypothetical protein